MEFEAIGLKLGERIAIVGGYGRMGSCFARLLKEEAEVTICGRRLEVAEAVAKRIGVAHASVEKAIRQADVVIVSVPIESTYEVCKQASTFLSKDCLMMDIASVKSGIADKLQEELRFKLKYVSIHPLFGPNVKSLKGRNIILIKGGDEESLRTVAEYFRSKGSRVAFLSVEEHDKLMAMLQVVHHFMLISFYGLFEKRLMKVENLAGLLPETLKPTLKTASKIMSNINAVMEIQRFNPYAEEARRAYARSLLTLAQELARKSE